MSLINYLHTDKFRKSLYALASAYLIIIGFLTIFSPDFTLAFLGRELLTVEGWMTIIPGILLIVIGNGLWCAGKKLH